MTTALGLRVVAALQSAVLVARPHGVVHFHPGALTRTGTSVPTGVRPLCGARTRRLRVVGRTSDDVTRAVAGRRFCRACTQRLPARLGGGPGDASTREGWEALYGDLTRADVRLAATYALSVSETYQVQRTAQMLFGSRHQEPELYGAIEKRRAWLVANERSVEEAEANSAARSAEAHNRRLVEKSRRRDVAIDRVGEKAKTGTYLTPYERELLNSA